MNRYFVLVLSILLVACSPRSSQQGAASSAAPAAAPQPPTPVSIAGGSSIDKASPATVGMAISGAIAPSGPSNFYRFENKARLRDVAIVRLENKSTTLRPFVRLYNADRSQITYRYDSTAGASLDQTISLDPGQVIYVEVAPNDSSGAYQLSVLSQNAFDSHEPNDDVLSATPVRFGEAVDGSIMDAKDADWYHVSASSSRKVEIYVQNKSTTLRPFIHVYSSSKSEITYKYDSTPGADLDFVVDVDPGRDFYIQVSPNDSAGAYTLSAKPAAQAADISGALRQNQVVDLYGVYFDTDQTTIRPASATTLSEVGAVLNGDKTLRLEVSGHTDNSGAKAHNMELSQGRAEAVVQWLVGQYGIDPSRLTPKGYGDTKPVQPNDNPAHMALNRRVELRRM